jgi:hypothetical protein
MTKKNQQQPCPGVQTVYEKLQPILGRLPEDKTLTAGRVACAVEDKARDFIGIPLAVKEQTEAVTSVMSGLPKLLNNLRVFR